MLSTLSHLEVLYANNNQNDRRPLSILSPEVQQSNPSCLGSPSCSVTLSLHMFKAHAWLGHWIKSAILRKYFCWSWQSGCEIIKQWLWYPQTAYLFQVYLILEPHIRKTVHTFMLWCCTILESQLFHSIATTTGSSALYLFFINQLLSKKLNSITVLELLF